MQLTNIIQDKLGSVLFLCIFLSLIPNFFIGMHYTILVGGFFVLQLVILLFYYSTNIKYGVNKEFFLFALIFMIVQGITLLISLFTGIEINYFDFINIFVRFFSVLLFVCIPIHLRISKNGLDRFMLALVLLGVVASVYNIIINFHGILNISNIINPYGVQFKSFFPNRNIYGQFLFFCIIANTYLIFKVKSKIFWISFLILGLNVFVSLSRTAIAVTIIFLLILLLYILKGRILTTIIFISTLVTIVFYIINNNSFYNYITNILIRKETGTSGRSDIWRVGFEILDQTNWAFGVGYLTSTSMLENLGFPGQFHSFYIETMVGGGVIDLILHIIILVFMIKKIYMIYRSDLVTGVIYFSTYIAFLFYFFFESASFFSMGYVDSLFRIFLLTIPLLYANNFKIKN